MIGVNGLKYQKVSKLVLEFPNETATLSWFATYENDKYINYSILPSASVHCSVKGQCAFLPWKESYQEKAQNKARYVWLNIQMKIDCLGFPKVELIHSTGRV